MKKVVLPMIPLVLFLALAEEVAQREWLPPFLFPAPSQVLKSLLESLTEFKAAFFQSALASALGLAMSVILGVGMALMLSASRTVRNMFYPYAIFFQTVPIIAIAPLLVIWLGYGLPTVIASAFIVSIFPVIANTVHGLLSTERELLDLFKTLNATRSQSLFQLRLPFALPQVLNGIRVAAGLSVIGAIVGEFIAGTGLGGLIDASRNQQRIDRVFAAVALAALLGILFVVLLSGVRYSLLKNYPPKERE